MYDRPVLADGMECRLSAGTDSQNKSRILSYHFMYKTAGFGNLGRSSDDLCLFKSVGFHAGTRLDGRTAIIYRISDFREVLSGVGISCG